MATQRTSFNKLQRDRDKQEKAAAKRDRRHNRSSGDQERDLKPQPAPANEQTARQLLDEVEKLHRQFDAGVIDFETFENTKTQLLSQLPVD
jgi:hypothetical protein